MFQNEKNKKKIIDFFLNEWKIHYDSIKNNMEKPETIECSIF
jgi:hypothetical protein